MIKLINILQENIGTTEDTDFSYSDKRNSLDKVRSVLLSSKNLDHLDTSINLINNFYRLYGVDEDSPEFIFLTKLINLMKMKLSPNRGWNGYTES
jgi:hypothetical protein